MLFARTSRGAVATPYGTLRVGHARDVIARLRRASRDIADLRGGTGGTVAVGTLPSAAGGLVPKAIARVLAERPRLRVTITEGQHEHLTRRCAGATSILSSAGCRPADARRIWPRPCWAPTGCGNWSCGRIPTLGSAKELTSGRPRDRPWILPPPDTTMRRQLDATFHDAGLEPPVPLIQLLSFLSNRALSLAGDDITVWPQQLASIEARRGQVAVLPVELPATERPLGLWWRADVPLSPAAQALADALRDGVGLPAGRWRLPTIRLDQAEKQFRHLAAGIRQVQDDVEAVALLDDMQRCAQGGGEGVGLAHETRRLVRRAGDDGAGGRAGRLASGLSVAMSRLDNRSQSGKQRANGARSKPADRQGCRDGVLGQACPRPPAIRDQRAPTGCPPAELPVTTIRRRLMFSCGAWVHSQVKLARIWRTISARVAPGARE
ncbi:MAG: LysR substrate-binding domain-containing protein [Micropepsaceae bacterium]